MMVLLIGMQACQNQDRKRDDASTTAADSTLDTTQRAQFLSAFDECQCAKPAADAQ